MLKECINCESTQVFKDEADNGKWIECPDCQLVLALSPGWDSIEEQWNTLARKSDIKKLKKSVFLNEDWIDNLERIIKELKLEVKVISTSSSIVAYRTKDIFDKFRKMNKERTKI